MTGKVIDREGLAINRLWRAQQEKAQSQQNAIAKAYHDVVEAKTTPVIHPATPKLTGETPAECQGCTIHKECRKILKMWYQRAPRPELVRAWCQLIDQHAGDMVCLTGVRS